MYNISPGSAAAVRPEFPELPKHLSRFSVSTIGLPPSEQVAIWSELWEPLMDVQRPDGATGPFPADQEAWDLGELVLAHTRMPAIGFSRARRHLRAEPIDHWCLVAVRKGLVQTRGSGRDAVATPGAVSLHSLRSEVEGAASEVEVLHLFIPRDFCMDAAATLDAADNTSMATGLRRLLADYLVDLHRRLPLLTTDELPGLLSATRAMVTACVVPSTDNVAGAQRPIEAALIERARQAVQRHLCSAHFGAAELCRELGVSRSRLYHLFEPMGGVVHYIRHRRLLDAHAALSNACDSRSIIDIAAERGFEDPSEFSRAFKREFGYRPTDARNGRAMHPVPNNDSSRLKNGPSALGELLRRLQ